MRILVTGAAGFIGFHLVEQLLSRGDEVVGLDNLNEYYDINLKYGRLQRHGIAAEKLAYGTPIASTKYPNYHFIRQDLSDQAGIREVFSRTSFEVVCNLAAQAGVRYSLENPSAYIESNIVGFTNILEACRHHAVKHLVYASSSSVYGLNETMPFSTGDNVDHPISLYAASKKSNELMAHTYSHLFGLPTTGLRFFTVYGPWGRPDMALFLFTEAILKDKPIKVFNHGNMKRDFTYVDDIVDGIVRVIDHPPQGNPEWSGKAPQPDTSPAPYKVYNIGNSNPVPLMEFIREIEKNLGKEAKKDFLPLQDGDVPATWADVSDLKRDLDYHPQTPVSKGIATFVEWYRNFYNM